MAAHDIAPGVPAALERFVLPEKLGFGAVNAPVMFSAEWRDGQWQRGTLLPYGPIEVWPGSRALQYAELIFEGLKAYKVGQPRPNLFRAADNCRRMERSGMNFFAVIGGELHTPELDDAILPGITRDSLLTLARHLGYVVHERAIEIDELLSQIEDRHCSELFACGTAAIVMPIAALAEPDERAYRPARTDEVASRLRGALLAIQERRAPDPFRWAREAP